jgi:zinc transporter 7
MICFACGTILGDVLLHIIPHMSEDAVLMKYQRLQEGSTRDDANAGYLQNYLMILVGISVFYLFDRVFASSKAHSHDHDKDSDCDSDDNSDKKTRNEPTRVVPRNQDSNEVTKRQTGSGTANKKQGKAVEEQKQGGSINASVAPKPRRKESAIMFLMADFMHNFIDGVALGVAFAFSIKVGISTLIAVFVHELPHEIGDFAVLVKKGYSISTVFITQLLTAFGALIGGLIGIHIGAVGDHLIGFTAGGFLYLGLTNMIPEIIELTKGKNIIHIILELASMALGVYVMYLIALSE